MDMYYQNTRILGYKITDYELELYDQKVGQGNP